MVKISAVLGACNQKDILKLVLESFNQQSLSPNDFEVIVVDSSSSDGSEQMAKGLKLSYPLNYFVRENRGKTAARNFGIRQAQADIILITDADMIAQADLIKEHLNFHTETAPMNRGRFPYGAAAEGLTYNLKQKHDSLDDTLAPANCSSYIQPTPKSGSRLRFSYFLTGNLSIRKEIISKAGRFDEEFTGYGWEDLELGYRMVEKMKVPLIYLPSAINYHYHFAAEVDLTKRKYEMGRSAKIFLKKHPDQMVRLFLGINPLAMGIYHFIKARPNVLRYIERKSKTSRLFQYILEEYWYRAGLLA